MTTTINLTPFLSLSPIQRQRRRSIHWPSDAQIAEAAQDPRFEGWHPDDIGHELWAASEQEARRDAEQLYAEPDYRMSAERQALLIDAYVEGFDPDEF